MTDKLELNPDLKKRFLEEIKYFIEQEMDEDIGDLRAEIIYDFIKSTFGKEFFNLGVNSTRKFMISRLEDLELDMEQVKIY